MFIFIEKLKNTCFAWLTSFNMTGLLLLFTFIAIFTLPKYSRVWVLLFSILILFQIVIIKDFTAYQITPDGKSYNSIFMEWSMQYNIAFSTNLDGLSLCFVLLTAFIFPICIISTWSLSKDIPFLVSCLLILELLLIICFTTTDLFFFYISFESVLIPMFLIIGFWGARERKIKAAYYFFLYTLFGSLFMLFGIIYLYFITFDTQFSTILSWNFQSHEQKLLYLCFFMAFATKIPMIPFHIWLPEAHVEAPTVGSVILASLLLKLGGYGFIRFVLSMFPIACQYFNPLIYILGLISIIYASLTAIRQTDLKKIIAYSSIAHMNLVVLGIFSFTQQGIDGAIFLMIAHGIVSAALFFCVGVLYDRYHTRALQYYGGLVQVMPVFSIIFFIFILANVSFPGTSNFVGEFLVLLGIFQKGTTVLFLAASGIILSAVYSFWLYNRVVFGTLNNIYILKFYDLNKKEFYVLVPLILAMFYLGLNGVSIPISSNPNLYYSFPIEFTFNIKW